MRLVMVCLASAVLATSALAGKVLDGKATESAPYFADKPVAVERLRVRHFAGPVVVVPSGDNDLHVQVSELRNMPEKRGGFLSRTPAVRVVLEEVSRGNFILTTEAPEGATKADLDAEPDAEPFFQAGPGVSFGANVQIGGGATPAADPTAGATRASLVVAVPVALFQHLSVETGFGDVLIRDFAFPKPVDEQQDYVNVFHGKSGYGKVRLEGVRHARFLAPTQKFSTKAGCAVSIETRGHEEKLDQIFR